MVCIERWGRAGPVVVRVFFCVVAAGSWGDVCRCGWGRVRGRGHQRLPRVGTLHAWRDWRQPDTGASTLVARHAMSHAEYWHSGLGMVVARVRDATVIQCVTYCGK